MKLYSNLHLNQVQNHILDKWKSKRHPRSLEQQGCITITSFPTTTFSNSALSWGERPTHQPVAGFTKDPYLNPASSSSGDVGGGLPDIVAQGRIS